MHFLILRDKKIEDAQAKTVLAEFTEIYETYASISPTYKIEEFDFTSVAGTAQVNFDTVPYGFIKEQVDIIYKKYKDEYDHILFWVHRDNWGWGKIWGENFSNIFYNYQVEICRFDNKNLANSLGTLYHEVHHSHDAFIFSMLGERVESCVGVTQWDSSITHGGQKPWQYIRHRENLVSLGFIASLLRQAYEKKRQVFIQDKISTLKRIVQLAQQVLILRRQLANKKTTSCSIKP